MVAKVSEYTKTTKLYTWHRLALCYASLISVRDIIKNIVELTISIVHVRVIMNCEKCEVSKLINRKRWENHYNFSGVLRFKLSKIYNFF